MALVRNAAPSLFLTPGDGERNGIGAFPTGSRIIVCPTNLDAVAESSRGEDARKAEYAISRTGEEHLISVLPESPRGSLMRNADPFALFLSIVVDADPLQRKRDRREHVRKIEKQEDSLHRQRRSDRSSESPARIRRPPGIEAPKRIGDRR